MRRKRQQLAGAHEYLHEETILFCCGIEIVAASRIGGIGRVRGSQLLDAAKDGVRRVVKGTYIHLYSIL